MTVKEIIDKKDATTEEMVFVVGEYINERKGVRVDINIYKYANAFGPALYDAIVDRERHLLKTAYEIAQKWYIENRKGN